MLLKDLNYLINPEMVVIIYDCDLDEYKMKEWYRQAGLNREIYSITNDNSNHLIIAVKTPEQK